MPQAKVASGVVFMGRQHSNLQVWLYVDGEGYGKVNNRDTMYDRNVAKYANEMDLQSRPHTASISVPH